jgi:hypothetical protein
MLVRGWRWREREVLRDWRKRVKHGENLLAEKGVMKWWRRNSSFLNLEGQKYMHLRPDVGDHSKAT